MKESVAIQPPTLDDAHDAAALHHKSWVATYTPLLAPDKAARLTLEERVDHWERFLRERPRHLGAFVAKRDGALVGLVEWEIGSEGDPSVGEIHAIHVAAEGRGRGVGRALLDASVAALRKSGLRHAILWVLEDNASARAFYGRQGWAWDGTRAERPLGGFEDFPRVVEVRYALDL
jgi:ribosomal protein S18 acetylase RimI-like enzyme